MRVATYNVRSLKQDRDAVVAVLTALEADVVALQEPPKWWRGRSRLARLAADCGLRVVVPGGLRGARTCAILARPDVPVASATAVRLRLRVRGREHWFPTLRGAALATVGVSRDLRPGGGADAPDPTDPTDPTVAWLVVACLHLSLDPGERAGHLRVVEQEIGRAAAALPGAAAGHHPGAPWTRVVAAGDLNELPGGPSWLALEGHGLHDTGAADDRPTFSADRPRRRLDVVLAGSAVRGSAHRGDHPLAALASDHLPVVASLTCG